MKKKYDLSQLDMLPEQDLDEIHGELLKLSLTIEREIRLLIRTMYISSWLVDEGVAKTQDDYEAMCAPLYKHEKRLESCQRIINDLDEYVAALLGRWPFSDYELSPEKFDGIKVAIGIAQEINRMVGTREDISDQDGPYLGYIYRRTREDAIRLQDLFK